MNIPWLWVFMALILFGAWNFFDNRSIKVSPGALVKDNPVQTDVRGNITYSQGKYTLEALANFEPA